MPVGDRVGDALRIVLLSEVHRPWHGPQREVGEPASQPAGNADEVHHVQGPVDPEHRQIAGHLGVDGVEPATVARERPEEVDGAVARPRVEERPEELVALGRDVELFPGVAEWFDEIAKYVAIRAETSIAIRHYLISSGLQEIIEGTPIYGRFHNVFASEYFFEAYDLPYPKRVITDTGKTQYLFRINKGIEDLGQSINSHMPEDDRPIPFANMVYFGDGDTDVPSMTVMRKNGGRAIAVHPAGRNRKKCVDLYQAGRVDFFAPADYRTGSELFKRTCLIIDAMLAGIRIEEERWKLARTLKE